MLWSEQQHERQTTYTVRPETQSEPIRSLQADEATPLALSNVFHPQRRSRARDVSRPPALRLARRRCPATRTMGGERPGEAPAPGVRYTVRRSRTIDPPYLC